MTWAQASRRRSRGCFISSPSSSGVPDGGEGGPDAYFATLPVKAMAQAMNEAGVPAEVSYTAGTYV